MILTLKTIDGLLPPVELEYICDNGRHLICLPYSIPNLHRMALALGIHRGWYHEKEGLWHYDIPKKRIEEIKSQCRVVGSREIVSIIKSALNPEPEEVYVVRASGDAICAQCGNPFKRHPFVMTELYRGEPYLNVLCDGTRVKL